MLDNNHSRLARTLGEYTVPAEGGSAVYHASSWTRLGKSREFTTYRTRTDETPVELASASISGTAVEFPTTSDPAVSG
jgi:hypothetical protein